MLVLQKRLRLYNRDSAEPHNNMSWRSLRIISPSNANFLAEEKYQVYIFIYNIFQKDQI